MKLLIIVSLFLSTYSFRPHIEGKLSFSEICSHYRYPVEQHQVQTDDDIILTIFRVQSKGQLKMKQKEKVVFWQHGLFDSSDGGIINSEDKAPIFLLANQGYDVWVGNSRGNTYSKESRDRASFWKFSFHEMGKYDLPAVLNYVRTQTNQKIHYIGHSQGTTQMFAALAMGIDGVESNLINFIALAPVTYVTKSKSLARLAETELLPTALKVMRIDEILFAGWYNTQGGRLLCSQLVEPCTQFFTGLMDLDGSLANQERIDVAISHFFAGTSTQNLLHWRKLVNYEDFVDFENQPYDLSNIKVKTSLLVGEVDKLAHPNECRRLRDSLTGVKDLFYKEYYMGHSTFLVGEDMSYFSDVIDIIEQS